MTNTLLSLLHLSDPSLPIGGYAHSSGLETYVQLGIVHNAESAKLFITQMLKNSIQHNDAAYLSLAYDAANENDFGKVLYLDQLCNAGKLPKETRLASQKLGMRLAKIFGALCNNDLANRYKVEMQAKQVNGHYSIVFALYAFALQLSKKDTLTGFYYNALTGFVTNSVKLVPLSQQDGQQILFSLYPLLTELIENTMFPDMDMLGLCSAGFDIRCMQHEELYSRLYMS